MEGTNRVVALFQRDVDFFLNLTTDHNRTLAWLRDQRLLPTQRVCCGQNCIQGVNNRSIDGLMFRCTQCRAKYSIREGTRWGKFRRIPLIVLTRLIFYYFPNQFSARRAHTALRGVHIDISYATVKRIFNNVRASISRFMLEEVYQTPLRGRIQMDEALFSHRAGGGRRGLRQVWVIGLVEERTSEAFCFVVPNRNSGTINNLITNYVLAGSLIIHDGWGGYQRIPRAYRHHRYLHDRDDINNTARIEGVWGELRAFIRNIYSAGVVEGNMTTVIQEINFRRRCRTRNVSFTQELTDILENY